MHKKTKGGGGAPSKRKEEKTQKNPETDVVQPIFSAVQGHKGVVRGKLNARV